MAYSSGFTAVTGATFLASQYNTYVRDNLSALWVFTTAGDLIYATSSTTAARLGIGSANDILRVTGGAPAWISLASLMQTVALVASQAAGDLFYALTGTTIGRLAKGTALQYLRMNSGATAPEWVTLPGLRLVTSSLQSPTWDGDVKAPATYTVTAHNFNASIPTTATALLMSVSTQWGSVSGGNVANIVPNGATQNGLLTRAITTDFQDGMGIVPLVSNKFDVIVSGANVTIYIDVWGYIE